MHMSFVLEVCCATVNHADVFFNKVNKSGSFSSTIMFLGQLKSQLTLMTDVRCLCAVGWIMEVKIRCIYQSLSLVAC